MTMLTSKQPTHYGYKSVHDLPTPPSTSRPSPPLIYQDCHKPLPGIPRSHSPSGQHMSAPLLPPLGMAMQPQPPPPTGTAPPSSHPPPPGPPAMGQPPLHHHHSLAMPDLPAPPPQWQGAEDSMRSWLATKAEEERRRQEEAKQKQEEEKTQQERLRLDQRRLENDMLQTSLSRGVPPPMVPFLFAGMSSALTPAAALEWARQFMASQPQAAHSSQYAPPGPVPPEPRRDSQGQYSQYPAMPSTPGSAQAQQGGGYGTYPPSPGRGRSHTVSAPGAGRQVPPASNLPSLNTNVPQSGGPGGHHMPQPQSAAGMQESQISFHHWVPPASQASTGSNQPATPSAVGESPSKKRKAAGPHHTAPTPPPPQSQQFPPAPFAPQGAALSHPPPGRKRGHARQQSDISLYSSTPRGQQEGPAGRGSPGQLSNPTAREAGGAAETAQPPRSGGAHTLSSILSEEAPVKTQQPPQATDGSRQKPKEEGGGPWRTSPRATEKQ